MLCCCVLICCLLVLVMKEKAMNAEEAPGAREAPKCTREAHQLRRETEGGLAAAVASVAAMYARGEGPGLTAFSDGEERPVAERLALLPRILKSKQRGGGGGGRTRRERSSNRSWRWMGWCLSAPLAESQPGEKSD